MNNMKLHIQLLCCVLATVVVSGSSSGSRGAGSGSIDFDVATVASTATAAAAGSAQAAPAPGTAPAERALTPVDGSTAIQLDVTQVEWFNIVSSSGGNSTSPEHIVLDAAGEFLYAIGSFTDTVTLGIAPAQRSFTSRGLRDIYMMKLRAATGELVWANQIGGHGDDWPSSAVFVPEDRTHEESVVINGVFQETAYFGATDTSSQTLEHHKLCGAMTCYGPFLAKYATFSGSVIWVTAGLGPLDDVAWSLILTNTGLWSTLACTSDTMQFSQGGTGAGVVTTYAGASNGVLSRFDHDNGALRFGRRVSSFGSQDVLNQVLSIPSHLLSASDAAAQSGIDQEFTTDFLVLSGVFRGDTAPPFSTRPTVLGVTDQAVTLTSRGSTDIYMLHLTASSLNKNAIWALHIGGDQEEMLPSPSLMVAAWAGTYTGVAIGATYRSDPLYIGTGSGAKQVGNHGGSDCVLIMIEQTSGIVRWVQAFGGIGDDSITVVAVHSSAGHGTSDALWVAGVFNSDSITFAAGTTIATTLQHTGSGSYDGWLAKFDAGSGILMFATNMRSGGSTVPTSIAIAGALTVLISVQATGQALVLGDYGTRGTEPGDSIPLAPDGSGDLPTKSVIASLSIDPPVDCVVTEWSDWSKCSEECSGGSQYRQRIVLRQPRSNGFACPSILREDRVCNLPPCVDCIMPVWPPRVKPTCTVIGTQPINCVFACTEPELLLEYSNSTYTCNQATGGWSGLIGTCKQPRPSIAVTTPIDPALVVITPAAHGRVVALVLPTRVFPDAPHGLVPSCSNASSVGGHASGELVQVVARETSTVLAVVCGTVEEGDQLRSSVQQLVVQVRAKAPTFTVHGPSTSALVQVIPPPAGQVPIQLAVTACQCFLSSVACGRGQQFSGPVFAIMTSQLSVAARSCPEGHIEQSWASDARADVTVSAASYQQSPGQPVRLRLQLCSLSGTANTTLEPAVHKWLSYDIVSALVLLKNFPAASNTFVPGVPVYDESRVVVEQTRSSSQHVNATVVIYPAAYNARSPTGLAIQLGELLAARDAYVVQETRVLRYAMQCGNQTQAHAGQAGGEGPTPQFSPISDCSLLLNGCGTASNDPTNDAAKPDTPTELGDDTGEEDDDSLMTIFLWVNVGLASCCFCGASTLGALWCHVNWRSIRIRRRVSARATGSRRRPYRTRRGRRYSQIMIVEPDDSVRHASSFSEYIQRGPRAHLGDSAGGPKKPTAKKATAKVNPAPKPRKSRASMASEDGSTCVVCMDATNEVMLRPCGHLCMCRGCANHTSMTQCPLCRADIETRIVFSWDTHAATIVGSQSLPQT